MSFSAEIKDFVSGFSAGSKIGGDIQDRKFRKEQAEFDRAFKQKDFDFEQTKFGYLQGRDKRRDEMDDRRFALDEKKFGYDQKKDAADAGLRSRGYDIQEKNLAADAKYRDADIELRKKKLEYDWLSGFDDKNTDDGGYVDSYARGGLVLHANEGVAVPEEPPAEEPVVGEGKSDLLVEQVKPILKDVFDHEAENLNQKPEAISTKKDQSRISVISGEGAATPDEIKAIDKTIDPDNQMEPYRKGAARLVEAYNFFVEKGDPEKARNVAKRIVAFNKQASMMQGKLAMAALERGDLQAASRLVTDAYNENIPDGKTLEAQPTPRGTIAYKTNNEQFAQQQGEIGAQELWALAAKVADGSEFIDRMTDLAATAKSKGTGGSYSADVSAAAQARNQLDAMMKQREELVGLEDEKENLAKLDAQIEAQKRVAMQAMEKAKKAAELTKRPMKVLAEDLKKMRDVEVDFAIPTEGASAPSGSSAPEDNRSWWGRNMPGFLGGEEAPAAPQQALPAQPPREPEGRGKPLNAKIIADYKRGLSTGKNPEAMKRKLIEQGYSTEGL